MLHSRRERERVENVIVYKIHRERSHALVVILDSLLVWGAPGSETKVGGAKCLGNRMMSTDDMFERKVAFSNNVMP